ncbi:MAG: hypothetical protein ACRENE_09460 [Polyangiaceae bacterium]
MRELAGAALACLAIAGCKGAPSGSTSTSTSTATATATSTPTPSPLASAPCRIIALTGAATADSTPLSLQGSVPATWLSLADGAHLVAKDPRTARETTFDGPARLRDCVGSAEEAWVGDGSFESTAGAGEAPGAEQWIVTPHAAVRYASAKVRLRVRATGTTVTMVAGVAFVWPPAAGATDAGPLPLEEGWQRLPTGTTTLAAGGGAGEAVARCTQLAGRSHDLTAALFWRDGGPLAGTVVTDQVTTRRLARAACALAHVRVEGAGGSAADASAIQTADEAWRSLPVPP